MSTVSGSALLWRPTLPTRRAPQPLGQIYILRLALIKPTQILEQPVSNQHRQKVTVVKCNMQLERVAWLLLGYFRAGLISSTGLQLYDLSGVELPGIATTQHGQDTPMACDVV